MQPFLWILLIYALLVIFVGKFQHFAVKRYVKSPTDTELHGLNYKEVEFTSPSKHKNKIREWFVQGNNNKSQKTIILVPGWGHTRKHVAKHIRLFTNNGFNVFVYDQRSHGDSDRAYLTMGKEEGMDFVGAYKFLSKQTGVNKNKIGAVGESLGGAAIIFGAPQIKTLKAIVFEGPYAGSSGMGYHMLRNRVFPDSLGFIPASIVWPGWWIGTRLWSDGNKKNGYHSEQIANVKNIPILFIRSSNDRMVPEKCANEIIDNANQPKKVWRTKNGRHVNALDHYPTQYKKTVLGFLNRYL